MLFLIYSGEEEYVMQIARGANIPAPTICGLLIEYVG